MAAGAGSDLILRHKPQFVTQCSVPESLIVLTKEHGVGQIEPMQVAVIRSKASGGSMAVDSLHKFTIGALRQAR